LNIPLTQGDSWPCPGHVRFRGTISGYKEDNKPAVTTEVKIELSMFSKDPVKQVSGKLNLELDPTPVRNTYPFGGTYQPYAASYSLPVNYYRNRWIRIPQFQYLAARELGVKIGGSVEVAVRFARSPSDEGYRCLYKIEKTGVAPA
jgi:hypothetical protein